MELKDELAFPLVEPCEDGCVSGGLTKLEYFSGIIAGAIYSNSGFLKDFTCPEDVANTAVTTALALTKKLKNQ